MGAGNATRVARDVLIGPFAFECWGDFLLRDALGRIVTPRSRKARALLAYLSSRPDTPVARDRLAGLLWSDRGEDQARASLRQCLHELRAFVHSTPPLIVRTREQVTMQGVALAHEAMTGDTSLYNAIRRGEGELFRDLNDISESFDNWLAAERTHRRTQLIGTGVAAIEAHLGRGQITEAREIGDGLTAIDPLDETAARAAMKADAHADDMGAVERRYDMLHRSLANELGVSPAPATISLRERLMTQDAGGTHKSTRQQDNDATRSPPQRPAARFWSARNRRLAVIAAVTITGIAGLETWRQERAESVIPTVIVVPQPDASYPGQSRALASALMIDLSRFAGANPQLLSVSTPATGAKGTTPGDFRVQVSASTEKGHPRIGLALIGGKDAEMLWSASFDASAGASQGELRQQAAVQLAAVLICAMNARRAADGAITTATLKLYLGVCDKKQGEVDQTMIAQLGQVTQNAPRFALGWADLALAEADLASCCDRPDAPALADRARLHLARARELDPALGQIYLAEALLVDGPSAYARHLALLDKGIAVDPDFPELHSERSLALMRVGRMREAVASARTAVELDPLSPWARNAFISALAYSGSMARARTALDETRRLWPDAGSTNEVLYRFNLRYGDASVALRLLDEAKVNIGDTPEEAGQRAFLAARTHPTPARIDAALAAIRDQCPQPFLIQAFGAFGRIDQGFAYLSTQQSLDKLTGATEILFRTHMSGFHRDPRFIGLAARLGLVAYWKSSEKWPDFCDDPELGYDCRREAARY